MGNKLDITTDVKYDPKQSSTYNFITFFNELLINESSDYFWENPNIQFNDLPDKKETTKSLWSFIYYNYVGYDKLTGFMRVNYKKISSNPNLTMEYLTKSMKHNDNVFSVYHYYMSIIQIIIFLLFPVIIYNATGLLSCDINKPDINPLKAQEPSGALGIGKIRTSGPYKVNKK